MLIDLDQLGEFEPVIVAQMRPVERDGRQFVRLADALNLLKFEVHRGDGRALACIMRLTSRI